MSSMSETPFVDLDSLRFDAAGLVPVVLQDAHTGAVLTLAYANREALEKTLATRQTHLYSRSRQELWHKGASSGNTQRVVDMRADCDADAVIYCVVPTGPACHTGAQSCFFQEMMMPDTETDDAASETAPFAEAMTQLQSVIAARKHASPDESYVAKLLARGVDMIGKKIGEEATEVVIAAKNNDPKEIVWEVADLFFHTAVLLQATGVTLDDVGRELLRRAK